MKKQNFEIYLKSVDRRWKKESKNSKGKIIIFSPYLTSPTVELILKNSALITQCEIYTVFSVRNFISGASSLKTVKELSKLGAKLYHLSRLHAKIIIIPQRFASIGSQNFTKNGILNKEATVVISAPEEIEKIEKKTAKWIKERRPISQTMIYAVEKELLSFRRKFCSLEREMKNLEQEIWENEKERLKLEKLAKAQQERQLELERQKSVKKAQRSNELRNKIEKLSTHQAVERSLAEEFIRKSAYWYDHICGYPVKAEKHARRVEGSKTNWIIEFGSNTFLVGKAICRCQATLLGFLDQLSHRNQNISIEQLREKLILDVRRSVANFNGDEYDEYSCIEKNYMKFGTQAINIDDFVNLICQKVELDSFIPDLLS